MSWYRWAEARSIGRQGPLAEISAEELEHIEDAWLDGDFERKLLQTGEVQSIKNISQIVEMLLGTDSQNSLSAKIELQNAGNGAAFAPAREKPSFAMPDFEQEEISNEMPVLPENPTEEQLWQYAENHPLVKKAMRIFRGKILEVKQTGKTP